MDLPAWLADTREWADRVLSQALDAAPAAPHEIDEVLRYAVFGGGKRLRPALVRLVCQQEGGRDADAQAPAAAVELVHTYSLVHDDLPCMDDDDLRRGRPTCHKVYGEALAVLAGDALQAAAFGALAAAGPRAARMLRVLAEAAGAAGMVGGQALDLALSGEACGPHDVQGVHRRKTAALIAASAELGALAADADDGRCAGVRRWGELVGLGFQATDDILDVTGDARTLGKTPGKDERADKPTLVAALGLEGARAHAARLAEEARAAGSALGWGASDPPGRLVDHLLARRS